MTSKKKIKNKEEWLVARQDGVGSADSPILAIGKVWEKTILDTYISKKQPVQPDQDNPNFKRGRFYEPFAAALFEAQEGIEVFAPETEEERFNDFMLWHPDIPYLFTDLDGYTSDGWIVEIKAPMQRVADKYRKEGIPKNYIVQGQHHIVLAEAAGLPGLDLPNGCPGVIFVIFSPETIELQIVRVPKDEEMGAAILANAKHFWEEHVIPSIPPTEETPKQPIITKAKGGSYTRVEGEGWESAVAAFVVADQLLNVGKRRLDMAKTTLKETMQEVDLAAVLAPKDFKFIYKEQAGKKSFDKKKLQADFPNLDLGKYEKQGKPFMAFRSYGPKAETGEGGLDDQLMTLHEELCDFSGREMDIELASMEFDSLRDRTELYMRTLATEHGQLEEGLEAATAGLAKMIKKEM